MLPEFHMVLESAENRGAKEITLPITVAQDLRKHIELLESQLINLQDKRDVRASIKATVSLDESLINFAKGGELSRDDALRLVAVLKRAHGLTSMEIGMVAAMVSVSENNE